MDGPPIALFNFARGSRMPTTQEKLARSLPAAIATLSDLGPAALKHISGVPNVLRADVFALSMKKMICG